ncbi:hypothetical protein Tco_1286742, partial [Tanacetum coccineum]
MQLILKRGLLDFAKVVWALAAFPTPTANVPSAERLAVTIVRAATAHFSLRHGAVAGNAAEPSGSDVFGVFYSTFMFLVLGNLDGSRISGYGSVFGAQLCVKIRVD